MLNFSHSLRQSLLVNKKGEITLFLGNEGKRAFKVVLTTKKTKNANQKCRHFENEA